MNQAQPEQVEVFLWQYTDEFGKRRVTRWRMSAAEAERLKDAVPVEGSRELRSPSGSFSHLQSSPPKS
jgi:hypothetical protein